MVAATARSPLRFSQAYGTLGRYVFNVPDPSDHGHWMKKGGGGGAGASAAVSYRHTGTGERLQVTREPGGYHVVHTDRAGHVISEHPGLGAKGAETLLKSHGVEDAKLLRGASGKNAARAAVATKAAAPKPAAELVKPGSADYNRHGVIALQRTLEKRLANGPMSHTDLTAHRDREMRGGLQRTVRDMLARGDLLVGHDAAGNGIYRLNPDRYAMKPSAALKVVKTVRAPKAEVAPAKPAESGKGTALELPKAARASAEEIHAAEQRLATAEAAHAKVAAESHAATETSTKTYKGIQEAERQAETDYRNRTAEILRPVDSERAAKIDALNSQYNDLHDKFKTKFDKWYALPGATTNGRGLTPEQAAALKKAHAVMEGARTRRDRVVYALDAERRWGQQAHPDLFNIQAHPMVQTARAESNRASMASNEAYKREQVARTARDQAAADLAALRARGSEMGGVHLDPSARAFLQEKFGTVPSEESYARLFGVQPGEQVTLTQSGGRYGRVLHFAMRGPNDPVDKAARLGGDLYTYKNEAGKIEHVLHFDYPHLPEDQHGAAQTASAFAHVVAAAKDHGVVRIETGSAMRPLEVARFGFTTPLSKMMNRPPAHLQTSQGLAGLMLKAGGPEWVRDHGYSVKMDNWTFNLNKGSPSRKVLQQTLGQLGVTGITLSEEGDEEEDAVAHGWTLTERRNPLRFQHAYGRFIFNYPDPSQGGHWHSNGGGAGAGASGGIHSPHGIGTAGVHGRGASSGGGGARTSKSSTTAKAAKAAKATTRTRTAAVAERPVAAPKAAKAETASTSGTNGESVRHIPIEQIHVGLNPREHFDPEKIAELAASIKEHGLLQPISVRPHEGSFQVIAGERRLRALKALNATHAPVIVHNVNDAKARELALIENINRADMRPSETARAYKGLQESGASVKEIAAKTGKSEGHIQQHLDLLTLPHDVQAAVDQGRIPQGVIRDLAKLSPAHQREAAAAISTDQMGLRKAKALTGAYAAKESQMDLFGGTGTNHGAAMPKALTKEQLSARDRYTQSIQRITEELHGLDHASMQRLAPAVELPHMESQRLSLMIQHLKQMQATLDQEQAARQINGQHVAASERRTAPRFPTISNAHLARLQAAVRDALTAAHRLRAASRA